MNTKVMFSSKTDQHATPQDLFDKLDQEFYFTLDVCADASNAKCPAYYPPAVDGLAQDWTVTRGWKWMNPPYGREIGKWVAKAAAARNVVALLPARVDTKWFHAFIWDKDLNKPRAGVEIRFIPGRLKFGRATNSAPFPSMLVVFR